VDLSGREIVTVALDLQSGDIEPYSGADFSSVDSIERVLEGQVDARGDKFAGLLESSQGTYRSGQGMASWLVRFGWAPGSARLWRI